MPPRDIDGNQVKCSFIKKSQRELRSDTSDIIGLSVCLVNMTGGTHKINVLVFRLRLNKFDTVSICS